MPEILANFQFILKIMDVVISKTNYPAAVAIFYLHYWKLY